jgi:hypothetical protein
MSRPERYRAKAEEVRTLADDAETPELRNQLLDVAGVYERLAGQVDQMDLSARLGSRRQESATNYAVSVERNTRLSADDPAAYAISVTPTFLPPHPLGKYAPANRSPETRDRWQGIVRGLDAVVESISVCLDGTKLVPRLIVRGSGAWVRLEPARKGESRDAGAKT